MPDPLPMLYPLFRYRDARAAIEFLQSAFGFREGLVVANEDGTIAHAELSYGTGMLMLGSDRDDMYAGHAGQGWVYLVVDDPDAHREQARAAGAEIITELHDTDYGSREYAARDLGGNVWSFGTYRPASEPSGPVASASGAASAAP